MNDAVIIHAVICFNGYSGRREVPCEVIAYTPKRARVKLAQDCKLAGRNNYRKAGEVVLVPRYAVREVQA